MIIADLNGAARVYGGRTIFRDLGWSIQAGEKIGLVGPNGVGKSSLLRILAGIEQPDAGVYTTRRGVRAEYLPQEYAGEPGRPVLAELLAARSDIAALEARIAALEARMGDPAVAGDMAALQRVIDEHGALLAQHEALGGPTVRGRAEALLRDLGLAEDQWGLPMALLSGGQRKMVGLARCLLGEPELLLLDEPDNHLDMERKDELEAIIRGFRGAVVLISHDRYLLDETVQIIVELEPSGGGAGSARGATLQRWEGNYSAYAASKELALLKQQQDFVAQQKEIAQLEAAVARFKLWASIVVNERHIKQARNKQRQIDRMDKVDRPVLERRKMALQFRPRARGGAKAVELRRVDKAFDEKIIVMDGQATIMNGERVGVVGPNGAGKSVLLRLICDLLPADGGEIWVGPSIQIGYYAQHHETLDMAQTPIAAMRDVRPMTEGEAVAQLGKFLIPYDATTQPIATLSGGEKSRVQLARLMLSGANCLLLDEPTNNLDIATIRWLENVLNDRNSTMIIISHDRHFLNQVCTHMADLDYGKITVYPGNYDDFMEASSMARQQQKNANDRAKERISELQDFVRRFSANKSKAKQATSRVK
ncbi:ATP-binding cassette domain-containing protein, partial [Oscillochloris sp. ZM17-4]|uniref:ABC transporter ATP-binding protein n=1 Tax=Oscillochloris sp. ZM17-4 TaxID=2866714 RepID=UPI001C739B25